jgi:hypothetical protein
MPCPGYDAWKLAYPPHWDDEPEEEEDGPPEEEAQALSGPTQCLDCHHVWDADEETVCEQCGSEDIESLSEP